MQEIEYVGHTINKDGIHFTRAKIDSILDMPKPHTKGDMKIFLGMVNYFHSHIANLSALEGPLIEMIGTQYTRTKRKHGMDWTPEREQAFTDIKIAVDKCPLLFFRREDLGPVYLQTDASDYGIGAYMFQLDNDGVSHRPIEFISKTLSSTQKRWGIPDKEAYAIFYALKKWEHHLRDREFILQTDHRNLTYVNFEGTAKVKRWKMLIQEFKFKIEYLPGPENIIADSFSRNCARDTRDSASLSEIDEEFLGFLEGRAMATEQPVAAVQEAFVWTTPDEERESNFLEFLEEEGELLLIDQEAPIPDAIHASIAAHHSGDKGHMGVKRTCKRLVTANVKIKHMREWVQRFIGECDFCQKQSYKRSRIETLPFTTAQTKRVMQRLAIDAIGPLEEDSYGYKYVLTVIDSFSRWVMAYPMKTQETNEVVQNIIKHIGIFGVPLELQTDGGATFTSAIMKEITDMLKAKRRITVAYSHEENALVERWNHEIIRYLRGLVYDANSVEDWSELLPFAQRICNAEVVESLGVSPAQIIFGAAINLDRAILTPNTEGLAHIHADHPPMSKYVEQLIETQQQAIDYARRIQKEKDDEHMMTSGEDITEFKIGSLVTTSYPANQDGVSKPPSKLQTKRKGPYVVLGHDGSTYQVKHLADHKITNVHISRLENFRSDATRVDPVTIAAKDQREFIVEEILEHLPLHQPAKNRSTFEFLVKWKYYDDPEENSWVPWADLTNNKICHRYCFTTPGLKSLVAMKYRDHLFSDDEDE